MEDNEKKREEKKIEELSKKIEANCENARLFSERGKEYWELGYKEIQEKKYDKAIENYDKAINDYIQVIRFGGGKAKYFNSLGNLYGDSGIIHNEKGNINEAIKNLDIAIKLFDEAIAFDKNQIDYLWERGRIYSAWGEICRDEEKYNSAIKDYTEAINRGYSQAKVYFCRGLAYYELKQYNESISDYSKASELGYSKAEVCFNIGLAHYSLGKYIEALNDYSKASKHEFNQAELYINIGIADYSLGKYQEAIDNYNKGIACGYRHAYVFYCIGLANYSLGEYNEAINNYNEAINNYNEANKNGFSKAELCFRRGLAYYGLKQYKEAISDYSEAFNIDEKFEEELYKYYLNVLIDVLQRKVKQRNEIWGLVAELFKRFKKNSFIKMIFNNEIIDQNTKCCEYILRLIVAADSVKQNHLYCGKNDKFIKYTGIKSLVHLIPKCNKKENKEENEIENNGPYIRLYNVACMNDPREGQKLKEMIKELPEKELTEKESTEKELTEKELTEKESTEKELTEKENALKMYAIIYENNLNKNDRKRIASNKTYLSSFSTALDELPMWTQYAERAEGVGIVFNSSFFDTECKGSLLNIVQNDTAIRETLKNITDKEKPNSTEKIFSQEEVNTEIFPNKIDNEKPNSTDNISSKEEANTAIFLNEPNKAKPNSIDNISLQVKNHLYKVWYGNFNSISDDEEIKKVIGEEKKALEEISECLKEIYLEYFNTDNKTSQEETQTEEANQIIVIVRNILDQIRFLYKDEPYKYEKEYRVVEYSENPKIDEERKEPMPSLYIDMFSNIKVENIDEVILGPKTINKDNVANYLYSCGIEDVTQSSIHYR